ncbi:nickel-dependent hydrogenase large subunit [Chromatium okenii]|jgi:ech hydrogenase subunit E|uniref:NADH-quinone oxidoreductase subunit D n=1 Tax=Chromatium okenii TaxID=61644 RepID=A0A2S7XR17_9GAMM|nr:nickel-dependent hydrogenase large subunit [Chromatium okenii]PQJ96194.1 NADH-quinone oxidoreductase subunit D [Chromatium okenii]
MSKTTIVPFGPQHPVLPEPIHLDLELDDERVVQALPSIGYVHRGLELLAERHDFIEMAQVAERICGICSFIHSQGYCQGIEQLLGLKVPPRAAYLRTMWAEMSRIQSHLLWLGLSADAFGFESLFQHSWRIREMLVDIIEETTGGRVIFGTCKVGGIRKDVDAETLQRVGGKIREIETAFDEVANIFSIDHTVRQRTVGIGVMTAEDAHALGAVGPVLRASGHAYDLRQLGYAAYGELDWEPVVETAGDCYARCIVRLREISQSIDLIKQCLDRMPDGEIEVTFKGKRPQGETMIRLEQPRGEVCYYMSANGGKYLERFRVRTPTFANIAPLVHMLKGCELADVPVILLTIDPCVSCNER